MNAIMPNIIIENKKLVFITSDDNVFRCQIQDNNKLCQRNQMTKSVVDNFRKQQTCPQFC